MRLAHRLESTSIRKNKVKEGKVNNPSYEDIIKELKSFLVDELGWLYQPDYNSVRFAGNGEHYGDVIDMNRTFMNVHFLSGEFTCKIKSIKTFMTSRSGTGAWLHFDMGNETYYKVDVRS